jgi:hypothetical protein
MSEVKRRQAEEIIKELAARLAARRCRGVKVNLRDAGYPLPEKINFDTLPEDGRVPDITSSVPDFIIEVEDLDTIQDPQTFGYCKQLSVHAAKTFRTFILAAPHSCMDTVKIQMSRLKIRNVNYIWY